MSNSIKWLYSSLCTATLIGSMLATTAQADPVSMESASANSVLGLIPQTMAGYWAEEGIDLQLSLNQTLTKSLLKVAAGKLDSAVIPPLAFHAMQQGSGPYKRMGDKAITMSNNVRSLFGMPGSIYHPITWADDNIKNWTDAAGKRVYIGPPAGAANRQIITYAAKGGLEQGSYEAIKAPWGSAKQSFQDGQFDVYIGIFGIGSQSLAELSLSRDIRLLSLSDGQQTPPEDIGMQLATIPPNTYPGQVNETPVFAWQSVMSMVVTKSLADEIAYKLTKTYFERRSDAAKTNAMLSQLPTTDHFAGLNVPLHPGAVRYYQEAGIAIPAKLLAK
ncbi:MAG: TAXI family TRAP transporter solute-binding subunit [Amphritea sp.]|nr:TAXI family TRAP transporter solute-binding subunit [Amphritea sp.]